MPSENDDFSAFLSLLVHELRTPANVVGGYLRILQRDAEGLGDRQRKMVDEAERSCQRLVGMIAELSEIQKLDAGILQLVQEPFDVFPLVERIVNEVKKREEFEVGVELHGPSEGARIRGDAARLESALSGILRAVLRELPPPTTVVVNRQIDARQKRSAVISIAEKGVLEDAHNDGGIPFDEKRGGLGLAIPLARRIVERHGGSVFSPDGQGRSIAILRLPLWDQGSGVGGQGSGSGSSN
jgi:signal transduction histidine kinase